MREDVESLDISDVTANWVNAQILERQIAERVKALADLSDTPLFFGRLDYLHAPGADRAEGAEGERFYVGRRHVHDADGDPMVVDWRAPVSQPFYRASKQDPMDLALRRRFGYTGGDLTAYEDEHLSDPAEAATTSRLLQQEIERPRVGPMRDMVVTIGADGARVRAGLAGSVCVQGGPGTGKTAVGLHRVAYLLYAHRERLARAGTLVIGPKPVLPRSSGGSCRPWAS
ncbi:DNA helicase OS=Streptomyces fumanus OX=67302 GN=GCM10018772_30550 PE=4 SV=1 [Streptomyces fumanus]